jgi:hypothetical protein
MFNIIVRQDQSVAFIDFEAASDVTEGRRVTVGSPGFAAPRDREGVAVDAYSLACISLAMFLPLTTLLTLNRDKAVGLAEVIADIFPVPAPFLDDAVREITGTAGGSERVRKPRYDEMGWGELRVALSQAIVASATLDRADRLFPGDIEQFAAPGGGLGLAHGAAGVLYALWRAADVRVPRYERWLADRLASPPRGCRLGLYDGLAGAAWVLAELGHTDAALATADTCLSSRWETLGPGLHGGLAGFSLAMIAIGDTAGQPGLVDAGLHAAELVAGRTCQAAGLMRGAAGPALLFIQLFERTRDDRYLDLAGRALAADLARCVTDRKGSLQVDEGWRMLPYLGGGSVGIGMVIDRFLAHRPSAAFEAASAAIRVAARSAFYAQSGLFNGRAGMICYLAGCGDPYLDAQVRRLHWHAMQYADGLAFPGDQLLRLSMDLGTGTAGILLALAAASAPGGGALPFLDPPGALDQGSVTGRVDVRR